MNFGRENKKASLLALLLIICLLLMKCCGYAMNGRDVNHVSPRAYTDIPSTRSLAPMFDFFLGLIGDPDKD